MADPYNCLRCSTISIGLWNILYCLIQFGVLGWQTQTVKGLQWEYENRQLPPTGAFPGLYAIYTETPERRRINAMYAIVLICLGLSIIHLMTTIGMLYGAVKRHSNWILPWFFTCAPLVVMCTAYSVLWWSGDVFNEQLTMSIAEFVMSLAINGIGFIVVLMYFLRITGRLSSDNPDSPRGLRSDLRKSPVITNRTSSMRKKKNFCNEGLSPLPPWHERFPTEPSFSLEKKLRRRKRDRDWSPVAAVRQGYHSPQGRLTGDSIQSIIYPFADQSKLRQMSRQSRSMEYLPVGACAQNFQTINRNLPTQQSPATTDRYLNTSTNPNRESFKSNRAFSSPVSQSTAIKKYNVPSPQNPQKRRSRHLNYAQKVMENLPVDFYPPVPPLLRRKSPQRVSFKSKPKIYQRTPDSSLSGGRPFYVQPPARHEIHTVV